MRGLILCWFAVTTTLHVHSQMLARLTARVDSTVPYTVNNPDILYDSVHFSYSGDRRTDPVVDLGWSGAYNSVKFTDMFSVQVHSYDGHTEFRRITQHFDQYDNVVKRNYYNQRGSKPWELSGRDSLIYVGAYQKERYYMDVIAGSFKIGIATKYIYNSKMQLTEVLDGLPPSGKRVYEYDPAGNVIKITDYGVANNLPMQLYSRDTFIYKNNKLYARFRYVWNHYSSYWKTGSIDSYVYNGNRLHYLYQEGVFEATWIAWQSRRTEYMYANNNLVGKTIEVYDSSSASWVKLRFTTIEYDTHNNPVIVRNYQWDAAKNTWAQSADLYYSRYYYEYFWPASVDDAKQESTVVVYPSPASSSIRVKLNTDHEQVFNCSITAMDGRLLREWSSLLGGRKESDIFVTDLPAGTYILLLHSPNKKFATQFSVL